MTTTYPGAADSFTNPTTSSYLDNPPHSTQHANANDAIEAIETVLGTTAGTSVLKDFAAGQFPARVNAGGTIMQTLTGGTINNTTLGTPTLSGLSVSSGTINDAVLGSPSITSGTLTSSVINGATLGSPSITSGTSTSHVLNTATVGTPTITGGTWTTGTINSSLLGSPTMNGGTISGAVLIGTVQHTGGTVTGAQLGTNTITGGTATSTVLNSNTMGSPSITGGTWTTGTINTSVLGTPTITGGTANSFTLGTPTMQAWDGWISANDTWSYVAAGTIGISAGGAAKYMKSDKIKFTQAGTVKYFYVIGVADTTLTVTAGSDYTVGTGAITANFYSHANSPIGFPQYFAWTPDLTLGSADLSGFDLARFSIAGNQVNFRFAALNRNLSGTSGGQVKISMPVPIPRNSTHAADVSAYPIGAAYLLVRGDLGSADNSLAISKDFTNATWAGTETGLYFFVNNTFEY